MKKHWNLICLAMLSFAGVCKSEPTNTFGLDLTAEPVDVCNLISGKGDWLRVKLQPTPIIAETDILAYDFKDHSLSLQPGALERVVKRLPSMSVWGIPFIVIVDGERIYAGAFMSIASSASVPVPCIIVWPTKPDTLQIDRAYPGPSFGDGPDPRSDERIRHVLATLRKLK